MIGDGIGTDTVRYMSGYQIFSVVTPITITSSGVLDLNGYSDTASPFTLNGGQITTGAGVLTVSGTVKIGGTTTVSGNVALSSTLIFTNAVAASILQMNAGVSGSYGITKTGVGYLFLSASNSYTGLTVVQQGWLYAQNAWALGATNSGTVVSNGATLVLDGSIGITNESLTLNGPGVSAGWGALDVESGTNTWAGPITNNANSTLDSWTATTALHIVGPISGAGGLELFGSGTHYFEGSIANTYAGATTVDAGTTLLLNKTNVFDGAVPQNLIVNGTVRLLNVNQIVNSSDVTVNSGGLLDIAVAYEGIDTLSGSGNVSLSGGDLYLGYGNGSSTFSGVISGSHDLYKEGSGAITLAGTTANTYAGITYVEDGTLVLNKSVANGAVPGNLFINDSSTVRLGANEQIADTSSVDIQSGGTLDLNNYNETIGTNLSLYECTVTTGSGCLTLSPNCTVTEDGAAYSYIYGNVNIGSGNSTWDVEGDLFVPAHLSGTANLIKSGPFVLVLQSSNSYSGLTIVEQGYLTVENPWALGSTSSGTIVSNQGSLLLDGNIGITNESLTLYGPGRGWGNLACVLATTASTNYWVGPITVNGDCQIMVDTSFALHLNGPISGPGGLVETFLNGTLSLEGTTANTYAGTTTVSRGTLLLGKSYGIKAVPGPLVIGTNTTVRLLNSFQIDSSTTPVTMSDSSLLDLTGFNEWIGPLSIQGAQITSGTGTLYLGGNIVVNPGTVAQSVISGNASIWSQTITITNSGFHYLPDLVISANVSSGGGGGQGLIKDGAGEVSLAGNNSFSGPVTINRGSLWAQTSTALGNTNTPATVNNGGDLLLYGIGLDFGLKPLVLNGNGSSFETGALECAADSSISWEGNVTLATDSQIFLNDGATLNLAGAISGGGGLTQCGWGTLTLSGSTANTYNGLTTVGAYAGSSTLMLNKTAGVNAVPGNLVINNGSIVRLANNLQTVNTADVLVNSGGLFDLGTYYEYIDTLRGLGTVNFGSGGWIYLGVNNGSSEFDGSFTGIGYASGFTVGKTGSGTFSMTGTNTFSAGNTTIAAGKMVINGYQPQSPVIVYSGATLGGSGTVGPIAASGIISPGTSPGILTSSNVTFTSSGNLTMQLTGPTPGTGYDQMNVRGTNALANATLTVLPAFTTPVAIGQKFIIINNDLSDAITGTFSGLAEGATNTVGGYKFAISYAGGTGNDVVLTLTSIPGAVTGSTVTSGNGSHGIDPNDCNNLSLVITNTTVTPMTGINATLSTTTEGVLITQPYATYPNIPANGSGTNIAPFQISTLPSFVCGNTINLQLIVNSSLGSFTMNYVLNTGESAAPTRFDNNTITNVPDIGTIESTNNVTSWSGGPITKVTVSLWLVAPIDSDLNLSLISPDGTTVPLSTANGAGANFGSGSADTSRTTFDDSAATAITAGSPPFVGTFRPQSPLSAFIGTSPFGAWRLHIQDSFGSGSPDTLRAWSLFLSGTSCNTGSGICDLCMPAITNAITLSDPVQTGRWIGNAVVASCGTPKTWPGTFAGSFHFDEYSFTNTSPADACVTVELQSPSNILATAYLNSFDPANITMNYLGDAGNSTHGGQTTFSCTVPAGASFLVVVTEVIANAGTQPYTLQLSGLPCPPPTLNIQPVTTNQALLYWSTAAGGYLLESESNIVASAWATVTNEPIVGNHQYNVINSAINPTNRFYRLHKP